MALGITVIFKYKIAENPSILEGVIIILLSIVLSLLMTKYIEAPIRNNKINKKRLNQF